MPEYWPMVLKWTTTVFKVTPVQQIINFKIKNEISQLSKKPPDQLKIISKLLKSDLEQISTKLTLEENYSRNGKNDAQLALKWNFYRTNGPFQLGQEKKNISTYI